MWYRDFVKTIIFAPILFFISTIMVLRSDTDLSSTCAETGCEPYGFGNVFGFNLYWFSWYLIGLQWTHFDYGPM
jgi:hypothetical protein